MKKLLLGMLVIPLMMVSCKEDNPTAEGEGKLIFAKPTVSTQTISKDLTRATPTDDFTNYWLTLDGPTNKSMAFPTDGEVEGLSVGNYTITVASHQAIPAPEFDVQYYKGSVSAEIRAGASTPVTMTLTQANAAVYFVYDQSLEDAGLDLVPTITGTDGTLVYSGENKEARGYFAPGNVVVTVADGENDYPIDGELEQTLTLGAREVWKVTLTREELPETGEFVITLDIIVEDDYTNEQVFVIGEPSPRTEEPDYIELNLQTVGIYYGSLIGDNEGPSEFILRLQDGNGAGAKGVNIHGFTQNAPFESFTLAEGEYTIGTDGSAMSFIEGVVADGSVSGSYGMVRAASGIATAYLASGGTVKIELSGNTYTITTNLSGTEYTVGPFSDLYYRYTGTIQWQNNYIPPGDLDFDDIVEGTYAGAGTPDWAETPGPGSWTGGIETNSEDTPPWVAVTGWSGSNVFFFLDYYNGNLIISDEVGQSSGYLTQANAVYWDGSRVNYLDNYIVDYDPVTGVFDFSGEVDGYSVIVGMFAFNPTTGAMAGVFGDAYSDATYTYEGDAGLRSFSTRYTKKGLSPKDVYFESPTGLTKFRKATGLSIRQDARRAQLAK